MKIKLDENLPATLVGLLAALGHDTDTVPQEGIAAKPDDAIWAVTQATGRFFITQDLNFSNIHRFVPETHEGLMLVRLHAPGRANVDTDSTRFGKECREDWRESCAIVRTGGVESETGT